MLEIDALYVVRHTVDKMPTAQASSHAMAASKQPMINEDNGAVESFENASTF